MPESRHVRPAALAVGVLAFTVLGLVTGPAVTGAAGNDWIGSTAPENAARVYLSEAGLAGPEGLPKFPEDTTELSYCPATRACPRGPFGPAESISFGILPAYAGAVTLQLTMNERTEDVFTCAVPGPCEAVATGHAEAPTWFHVTGVPKPGSTGGYVLWVAYG